MTDWSEMPALLTAAEQKFNLPPGILHATYAVETGAGRNVRPSSAGAVGPMQFMPATAKGLGINPMDPAQAADGAGKLWQQNLQAAGGDIDKAAMMYNAGPNPQHWNNPETRAYPGKLVKALGPQAQGGGDPIEAALSGQATPQQAAPQSAPVDPHDPIENALAGNAGPSPQDLQATNAEMRRMFHGGAKTQDIIAYGVQHGVNPNPDQIDHARSNNMDVQFVQPDQQQAPAPNQPPQTNQALGFAEGLAKPLDNAATWLEHGADAIGLAKPLNALSSALGLAPSQEAATATHQDYFKQQEAQGQTPGGLGKFAGEVAGTIPAVLATKNPWIAGGLSGALTTDDPNDLKQTAIDAGIGAVGGKVAHAVTGAAAGVVAPKVSKMAQALNDLGATLTPGTIVGGATKRIEDGVTSIPLLGDLVRNAQRRSALSLNTATLQSRVLDPLGKVLPKGMVGREAIENADNAASNAYEGLLPKLNVVADRPFIDNMSNILKTADELPSDRAAQVQRIVNGSFLEKFNRPGLTMTGDTFKEADSKLGQLAREYGSSGDPEQRKMGGIFRDVQGELREMLVRANPAHAAELSKINLAFANLVRIEGAAGSAGAKGGVWSPSQLASAVKRFDPSPRKKSYAMGKALLQDVSDPANEIMPASVPDSGTPYRTVGAYLLGGGLSHVSPWLAPVAAPMGIYTEAGQKAFQRILLAPRTPAEKALAKALTQLKAPLAVAGGAAGAEATNGR